MLPPSIRITYILTILKTDSKGKTDVFTLANCRLLEYSEDYEEIFLSGFFSLGYSIGNWM